MNHTISSGCDKMTRVDLYDGKYSIIEAGPGELIILRYAEPWRAGQEAYGWSNLVRALVHRIIELEGEAK